VFERAKVNEIEGTLHSDLNISQRAEKIILSDSFKTSFFAIFRIFHCIKKGLINVVPVSKINFSVGQMRKTLSNVFQTETNFTNSIEPLVHFL
jgi:hypothetical protein